MAKAIFLYIEGVNTILEVQSKKKLAQSDRLGYYTIKMPEPYGPGFKLYL